MGLPRSAEEGSTYEKSKNKKKKKKKERKKKKRRGIHVGRGSVRVYKTTTPQKRLPLSLIRLPTLPPFFSPPFFFLLYDRPVRSFRENSSPRASPTAIPTPVFLLAVDLTAAPATTSPRFDDRPREFLPFDVPSQHGRDRISARRARFPFRQTGNPSPLLTSIVKKIKFSFLAIV